MYSEDNMHDVNDSAVDDFYSGGEAGLATSDDGDADYVSDDSGELLSHRQQGRARGAQRARGRGGGQARRRGGEVRRPATRARTARWAWSAVRGACGREREREEGCCG
ncbi:unnamed protein product [Urochloa humidicola]